MADGYDGSLNIVTKLDNEKMEKQYAQLKKNIQALEKDFSNSQKGQTAAAVTQEKAYKNLQKAHEDLLNARGKRDSLLSDEIALTEQLDQVRSQLIKAKDAVKEYKKQWVAGVMGADRNETSAREQVQALQTEYDGILAKINKIESALSRSSSSVDTQEARVQELTAAYEAAERAASEAAQRSGNIEEKLSDAKKQAGELVEKLQGTNGEGTQSRLTAYLEKNSGLYQQLTGAAGKMSEASAVLREMAGGATGKLSSAFQAAGQAIGGFSAELSGAVAAAGPYIAIASILLNLLKKLGSAFGKFMRTAVTALQAVVKTTVEFSVSVAKNFVALLKSIGENLNVFSKLADTLSGKFKRLGNTIKSALVFSVIYKGLSTVREQMGAYLSVNTQFMTALRQLQGVLLTVFQPIYEIAVPALTTLINVLTHAAATVTQFFASLFGTTAKQAQANAKALYEEAGALKETGKAAEKAIGALAGFDEINTIQTEDKSGSGGGSSAGTGPLFDYEYDETPFDTWGEAFSALLDRLLDGIQQLRDTFGGFADWLNGFTLKLYNAFTFPGVLDKVKALGRELADALNDLVNSINWEQAGRALGAGLNLALNFLTSFLYEFDWMNLGNRLAEFINGLVSEIDWYEFGRLLWAGFKIGLGIFAGFLAGLNMPQLAQAASSIILGFFTEMENTLRNIPWIDLGRQVAVFLNEIQWYDIITGIADAIHAGIIALYQLAQGFIGRLDWNDIAEQIYTAINDSLGNEALFSKLSGTLSSLFIHICDFCREVIAGTDWEQLGRDIAAFILGFDWVGALGSLADLIAGGINAAVRLVRGFLDTAQPNLQEIAGGIAEKINQFVRDIDWTELGQTIHDGIAMALDFLIEILDQLDWDAIRDAVGTFLGNLDWSDIAGKIAKLLATWFGAKAQLEFIKLEALVDIGLAILDGIKKGILLEIGKIGIWLKEHLVDPIVEGVKNLLGIHSPSTVFAEIGENLIAGLLQGISDTWSGILEFFTEKPKEIKEKLAGKWEEIQSGTKETWETIKKDLGSKWSDIKESASTKFEETKEKISGIWGKTQSTTSEKWKSIESALRTVWENTKKTASTTFEAVREKITGAWDKSSSDTSQKWNSIKSTLNGAWDTIKSTATSKFESIRSSITGIWSGLASSASSWGRDICSNIASGISGAISTVTSAVRSVADTISSFLHFSEPDVGPLSNFHTFMPDMLELMADGIHDNANLAVDAAEDLAGSVANALGGKSIGVNVSAMPDFSNFSVPNIAVGAVIPSNREFMSVLAARDDSSGQQSGPDKEDDEIVALLQAILDAIKKGRIIVVDGDVLGRATQKALNDITTKSGKFALKF